MSRGGRLASMAPTDGVALKFVPSSVEPSAAFTALCTRGGALRRFHVTWCESEYTLPELYEAFAAHVVEWSIFGRDTPWWSVHTHFRKGKSLTSSEKLAFYSSGEEHVGTALAQLEARHGVIGPQSSVLDFGCGLGRLALAFARRPFARVVCVDQSIHHLRRARLEIEGLNATAATRIAYAVSTPDLLGALRGERFDVVHSVIAMQHMVAPLQAVYLEQLCDALRPGGRGWIQIPVNVSRMSREATCDLGGSIGHGGMQMHYTPVGHIERALRRRGCEPSFEKPLKRYVSHTFTDTVVLLRKRREASLPLAASEIE